MYVYISTCEGIALQKANIAVDGHIEFRETPEQTLTPRTEPSSEQTP